MVKYVSIILTRGQVTSEWWEEDEEFLPSLFVDNATPEFTGILDADANPIMKMPRPIGFGRDSEW
jgi:hypothetical protein